MSVTTLDTHELVKDLKSAGFTDEQAEAVTRAVKQAQQIDLSDLATKADVFALKGDVSALGARLDNMDTRMANFVTKAELADTRTDVIKWVVGIAFAQVAAILAILKLFPAGHP
jgi:phage I-like protein